jgi:hypothetical protein
LPADFGLRISDFRFAIAFLQAIVIPTISRAAALRYGLQFGIFFKAPPSGANSLAFNPSYP